MPSSRQVLLKDRDPTGFVFYTNVESQKGRQLIAQGKAALNFFWRDMGRQIRIQGEVALVSDATADAYFASRSRGSRIGAWASQQSRPLDSREEMIARTTELEKKYEGIDVPRPPHWSGFRLVPSAIEFWQAGEFRLHDRFVFVRHEDAWNVSRLNP
jgi:pyridoxamine 5'-phosphate oxidase